MKEEKTFQEKIQERLQSWKGVLEDLQVQLNLGSKEAQDRFEEQKKRFRDWIDQNRDRLDDVEEELGDEAGELREKLKELMASLEKSKAEGEEAFAEQKEKISQKLQQLREQLGKAGESGSEKAKTLFEDWDDDISRFRTHLDMLALQFHLGLKEAGGGLDQMRAEAQKKLAELKKKISDSSQEPGDLWNSLSSDVKDAFNRLASSFKEKDKNDDRA